MIDLHNDFLTEIKGQKNQCKYAKCVSKSLDFLCCPVWTTNIKNAKNYIKNKQKMLKTYKNLQICVEDAGFLENNDFDFLIDVMPKYVGLVWNKSNKFCGGAYDSGGLTILGKKIVKFLQDSDIIVDTAHMNYKSFFDFASVTQKPIFCSHSGFCGIVNDKRNLKDRQLDIIVQSGGLVGLYFVGKYICKNKYATSDDVVKNIDYFVQKYGTNSLAIGSDFFGTTDLPVDVKDYFSMQTIKQKLKALGYKQNDIKNIFENNAKRALDL